MANKHYRRWLLKMPLGFLFVAGGMVMILYSVDVRPNKEWVMLGGASIVIFIIGLIFLGSAYTHKVKSDLIKKGRPRSSRHEGNEEE
jgi:uncharacterized membrane protein HdeD (DUF308 family)